MGDGLLVAGQHHDFFHPEAVEAGGDGLGFVPDRVGQRKDREGGHRVTRPGANPHAGFSVSGERSGMRGDHVHPGRSEFAEEAFASDDHAPFVDRGLGTLAS